MNAIAQTTKLANCTGLMANAVREALGLPPLANTRDDAEMDLPFLAALHAMSQQHPSVYAPAAGGSLTRSALQAGRTALGSRYVACVLSYVSFNTLLVAEYPVSWQLPEGLFLVASVHTAPFWTSRKLVDGSPVYRFYALTAAAFDDDPSEVVEVVLDNNGEPQ